MASFNTCTLIGNLGRKPELRYTTGGKAVASFGLAVNRRTSGTTEEVLWIDVTAWEKQAEAAAAHLDKGSQVLVNGYLKMEKWQDREGHDRTKIVMVAVQIVFLGRPAGATAGAVSPAAAKPRTAAPARADPPFTPAAGMGGPGDPAEEEEAEDGDIPF
jgi:single-strand DNA-binding protein